MGNEKNYGFDTLALHAGQETDPVTRSRAVPIYQTSAYTFDSSQYSADLFNLKESGNIYTRIMNPTTDVLEKRLAALEGGSGALCVASGMSATFYAIMNLSCSGDEIISLSSLYGGTYTLLVDRFESQFGIKTHLVPLDDLELLESTINERTKAIYYESIANPEINIPLMDEVGAIAHKHGIPVIVDNTFGTAYLIQLKEHNVDIVVHSLTKYVCGHGTTMGGAIVDLGTFDYHNNPRFPQFNQPDKSYHGLVYADLGPTAFITRARVYLLRDIGAAISPFNSFLLLQGVETLGLRVERHCENAQKAAEFLNSRDEVAWVSYPGLKGDKYYDRAQKYFPKGVGAILSFGIKGGVKAGAKFIDNLKLISHVANLADAKSLVIHPASSTHSQLDEEGLKKAGVAPDLIRLSVGLENIEDILDDLDHALKISQQ